MTTMRNINIMDFSSMVQSISGQRRTGTLRVIGPDEDEKMIYFNRGNVELVLAKHRKFLLGEALVKYGKLGKEQLEEALARQRKSGKELGKVLVEMGVLTERDIQEAVAFQITEEVCDIFTWEKVDCEFLENQTTPEIKKILDQGIRIAVNPESLIMEAARRIDEWEIIKKIVPSTKDVFQATPASFHYFQEDGWDAEREVLSLIDGVRDVAEVIQKARMSKFDALKVLHKLASNGEVVPVPGPRLVELGLRFSNEGNLRKAIRLFERAEELGVEGLEVDHKLARAYEAMGNAEKAVSKFLSYARRKEEEGDLDAAVYAYGRIINLQPDELRWHRRLIEVLIKQGRKEEVVRQAHKLEEKLLSRNKKDEAVALWKRIQQAAPDIPVTYEALAKLHLKFDETVQAIIELENLAGLHLMRGEKERAVKVFRRILQLDDECVQARMSLAATLADLGRTKAALDEYTKLANMLQRTGIINEASNKAFLLDVYRKMSELAPEDTDVRWKLMEVQLLGGDKEGALTTLNEMREILTRKGDGKEGLVKVLEKISELKPNDEDVLLELGDAYAACGMSQQAIKIYERLALAFLQREEYEKALTLCGKCRKVEPLRIDTFWLMAEIYGRLGETVRQAEFYRQIAWLHIAMEDYEAAEKALVKASELHSADLGTLLLLADTYQKRHKNDQLKSLLLRLAKTAVKQHDIGLASRFIDRLEKMGASDESVKDLKKELNVLKTRVKEGTRLPVIERPIPHRGEPTSIPGIRIIKPKSRTESEEE